MKPVLKVTKTDKDVKREERKLKLTTIADKKAKGKLTLEDINDKLDIVIEMLSELVDK